MDFNLETAWQLYREYGQLLVVIYPSCDLGPHEPKASGQYIQNLIYGRMHAHILAISFPPDGAAQGLYAVYLSLGALLSAPGFTHGRVHSL